MAGCSAVVTEQNLSVIWGEALVVKCNARGQVFIYCREDYRICFLCFGYMPSIQPAVK